MDWGDIISNIKKNDQFRVKFTNGDQYIYKYINFNANLRIHTFMIIKGQNHGIDTPKLIKIRNNGESVNGNFLL